MKYDCVIIGGGIAGLQAAIQLGRYQHNVLVIDSNNGRSNLCRCYHNIIGWPNGVSGQQLRSIGTKQAIDLGVQFQNEEVLNVSKDDEDFIIKTDKNHYNSKRLLFCTGIKDNLPEFESLYPCLGISVYVCPDCDGYEVKNKRTIVIGSGNVGANMALTLTYWTKDLIYINHNKHQVDDEVKKQLVHHNIDVYDDPVTKIMAKNELFEGVQLESGKVVRANHAFVAMGGNQVKSKLASDLGVDTMENKHIVVNPRTQMTNVENVWAAGDVVAHSEQVTIAMGDGMQAAIWIHKTLLD